jgi:gingipain R
MKRFVWLSIYLFVFFITKGKSNSIEVKVLSNSISQTIVEINFPEYNFNGNEKSILLEGCTPWQIKGCPDLCKYTLNLQIPKHAIANAEIVSEEYWQDKSCSTIEASTGKISRANGFPSIKEKNESFFTNAFFPTEQFLPSSPFIMRDVVGQNFHISVFQYNPIQKIVRQFKKIKLEINYTPTSSEEPSFDLPQKVSETFYAAYKNQFINFEFKNEILNKTYPLNLTGDHLLVLCPSKYLSAIAPFVAWKKTKGIYTTLVNTDTLPGGVSQNSIYQFIKNLYQYQNNSITNVMLVGNNNELPVYKTAVTFGPGSDNPYGYIDGADNYVEVIVGRMVANYPYEVERQVYKAIEYEKHPDVSTAWYSKSLGIASVEGTGDDNEYDWEHIRNIQDSLISQGPLKGSYEFFDGSQSGKDAVGNPALAAIIDSINNGGTCLINYAGHGTAGGLITSGWSVFNTFNLQNTSTNWPYMVVVGCKPGYFNDNDTSFDCFAEVLANNVKANTTQPSGLIISAMSTVDQWWREPMEAQDEFNALLMNNARPYNTAYSFGALMTNGMYAMMNKYNITPATPGVPSDTNGGKEMTDCWQIFGDPTLIVRTDNKGAIVCNHNPNIPKGSTTFSTTCNVNGAWVCLYYKNEILAVAKASGGVVNFTFPAVQDSLETVLLTATAYNYTPYLTSLLVANYPVSISNVKNIDLSIYPNPSKDYCIIESSETINRIKVINQIGKVVVESNPTNKNINLSTQNLPNGIYSLVLNIGNQTIQKRISVSH